MKLDVGMRASVGSFDSAAVTALLRVEMADNALRRPSARRSAGCRRFDDRDAHRLADAFGFGDRRVEHREAAPRASASVLPC